MKYKMKHEDTEEVEVRNEFKLLMGATLKRLGNDLIGSLNQEKLEAIEYLKNPDPEFLEQLELADLKYHYDKLENYARQKGHI